MDEYEDYIKTSFVVAICNLVHAVEACKLLFHGHHLYFRKDFQLLLAHKKGERWLSHRALIHI